jgi:ABC-type proline/glycine betaine transport system substrate-binding protein
MSDPIYKLCLMRGYTEAYYQLSQEGKDALWAEVSRVIKEAGAEMAGPYYDCRWSNDKYDLWFTMKYPNIESAIADTDGVRKAGLFRYMVSETILGIERKSST